MCRKNRLKRLQSVRNPRLSGHSLLEEMMEHLEAFHRYEYNLKESLSSIKRLKRKSLKNRRLANFGPSVSERGRKDCPTLTDLDSDDEELPIAAWVEIWNATSE